MANIALPYISLAVTGDIFCLNGAEKQQKLFTQSYKVQFSSYL